MEIFKPFGFDKPTAGITLALLVVGFTMVFSSSAVLAEQKYNQSLYFLIQQLIKQLFQPLQQFWRRVIWRWRCQRPLVVTILYLPEKY
jgi:cell division protein FtsW (lipid II flippase)